MRDLSTLYGSDNNITASYDLGTEYTVNLLRKYQLSVEELTRIFDYCHEIGIEPLCTPWDDKSLEYLNKYGMSAFKIASTDLVNHDLLVSACKFEKPLICSTGMSSEEDIRETIKLLELMVLFTHYCIAIRHIQHHIKTSILIT